MTEPAPTPSADTELRLAALELIVGQLVTIAMTERPAAWGQFEDSIRAMGQMEMAGRAAAGAPTGGRNERLADAVLALLASARDRTSWVTEPARAS